MSCWCECFGWSLAGLSSANERKFPPTPSSSDPTEWSFWISRIWPTYIFEKKEFCSGEATTLLAKYFEPQLRAAWVAFCFVSVHSSSYGAVSSCFRFVSVAVWSVFQNMRGNETKQPQHSLGHTKHDTPSAVFVHDGNVKSKKQMMTYYQWRICDKERCNHVSKVLNRWLFLQ